MGFLDQLSQMAGASAPPLADAKPSTPSTFMAALTGVAQQDNKDVTPNGLQQLIMDESSGKDRLVAYKDQKGINTVGHGFNLDDPTNAPILKQITGLTPQQVISGKPITVQQQNGLLAATVKRAEGIAQKIIPNFTELPSHVQDAVSNFVFNVGETTARKFTPTLTALANGNGPEAAARLRKSPYYRQVGARGERIAKAFESYTGDSQ